MAAGIGAITGRQKRLAQRIVDADDVVRDRVLTAKVDDAVRFVANTDIRLTVDFGAGSVVELTVAEIETVLQAEVRVPSTAQIFVTEKAEVVRLPGNL